MDTVAFFPTVIPYLKVNLDDYLRQAATDIITILTTAPSPNMPTLIAICNALLDISIVLTRADKLPTPVLLPPPQRGASITN